MVTRRPEQTDVRVTPTENADHRVQIPCTINSSVSKSLLSEKHYWAVQRRNPDLKVRDSLTCYMYGAGDDIPQLGSLEVGLTNLCGMQTWTMVYVAKNQWESRLGLEDASGTLS